MVELEGGTRTERRDRCFADETEIGKLPCDEEDCIVLPPDVRTGVEDAKIEGGLIFGYIERIAEAQNEARMGGDMDSGNSLRMKLSSPQTQSKRCRSAGL